jgi:hypothetical protein
MGREATAWRGDDELWLIRRLRTSSYRSGSPFAHATALILASCARARLHTGCAP